MLLSLGVAIWIFWFLYKDISAESLLESIRETSFFWMGISIFVSIFTYLVRAWRWKLLIEAGEEVRTPTVRVFWALMLGYLGNLLVPRAGEVVRCGVLAKTDDAQLGKLMGTVLVERTIDLLFLMLTVFLAFFMERTLFVSLFNTLVSVESLFSKFLQMLPLFLGGSVLAVLFFFLLFRRYKESSFLKKLRHFVRDLVRGMLSLGKVNNPVGFWGSSLLIWIGYYLMMVAVAWAIPSTANLSPGAVLMVMVMGSIGMVAPVQGGIGTFHALVAYILLAYGLKEEEGKIFAAIIHGSQVLTVIVVGLVSLGFFFKITSQKASKL